MSDFMQLVDAILHLNLYVGALIDRYGFWAYFMLALVIFCETGLVIMPFLPGDSLLFAAGSVFAASHQNINLLVVLLVLAAFLGDNSNYWLGRHFGRRIFTPKAKILKLDYLRMTEAFYQKHGPRAILAARLIPLFRTLVPFFAGISKMAYGRYLLWCFFSAAGWVGGLLYVSYFFGNIPFIKANFVIVLLAIVLLSAVPVVYHYLKRFQR